MQLSRPTFTILMTLWVAECRRANPINTFAFFPSSNDRESLSHWKLSSVKSVHRALTPTEFWENVTRMCASSIFCRLHQPWKCLKLSHVVGLAITAAIILSVDSDSTKVTNWCAECGQSDWRLGADLKDQVRPCLALTVKSCWDLLFKYLYRFIANILYPVLSN